jgi:hypothetical protein
MSITSILNYNNKQYKGFRTLLDELFPTPKFEPRVLLKAEPLTKNYGLIGTAFDYLLRFALERKYSSLVHGRPWVSETALNHFEEGGFTFFGNPDDIDFDNIDAIMKDKNEENKKVKDKFEKCKSIYKEFITNKININNDILEACLFLSRLDLIVRDPFKNKINLAPEDAGDLSDLRLLLQNCNLDKFRPREKIILNPTFGKASELVGRADADLVVDSTLIDIKTTLEIKLTRHFYNQLICYYILYLIGGLDNFQDSKIDSIGIYFSRYDFLWTLSIEKVGKEEDFKRAITGLKSSIKKK